MKGMLVAAIVGTFVLVSVGAGYLYFSLFPAAPQITAWGVNSTCDPIISFIDKSTNEIGFRISFRPQGASNFSLIKVLPAMSGKGTTATVTLSPKVPAGNYDYRVEAFTEYGPASDTQTVNVPVSSTCSDIPPLPPGDPMPFFVEPLIVKVTIQNDCDVVVDYLDFNTSPQVQEDGLRIYRNIWNQNKAVIANLPPADNGTYLDPNLPPEDYQYVVSAYKGNTELFSAASWPVDISFDKCLKNQKDELGTPTPAPTDPTSTSEVVVNITPKKLSCEWEAAADVFLRKGPDVGLFDRLIDVPKGRLYPIVGQSEDGQFWALEVEPGVIGYITKSEKYSRVHGDCESVSTRTDPEPPEVLPAATKKPGGSSDPSVAQCSDGVDNDGDGLIDYNPFGSGDPGCASAEGTSE